MDDWLIEWKIENLSSWCEAVHGRCIQSPKRSTGCFETVELYPRGQSGQDDRMDVLFCGVVSNLSIDLSFFDFDGSLMCSKQKTITNEKNERILGPKLEEILNNKKDYHKDVITLSFLFRNSKYRKELMYSTIKVSKVSLKLDAKCLHSLAIQSGFLVWFLNFALDDKFFVLGLKLVKNSGNILLHMQPVSNFKKPFLVESCINLVNGEEAILRHEENKHVFADIKPWEFSECLTEQDLKGNGNTISLLFNITGGSIIQSYTHLTSPYKVVLNSNFYLTEPKLVKSSASTNQRDDSVSVLTKELLFLYQDQKFSDCQLKCGDITFPVHKNILSARSPVFETMLSCDMQEAASGQVDIRDLDPSTLSRFLTFLYTGSVGEEGLEEESALNLYYAADKYQVPTLKKECADFLCSKVSVSNVCDVLSLADKHKNDDLMAASHKFILDNYNGVLSSEEWDKFMEKEPILASKTLTDFARKKHVDKK